MIMLPDWPIEASMAAFLKELSCVLDEAGYLLVTYTCRLGDRARRSRPPGSENGYRPAGPSATAQNLELGGNRR